MPNGEATALAKQAPSLEERLSIFDSIGKSLEDLVTAVREIPKTVKEAAYYTYYTAKAALGLATGVAMVGAVGGYHAFVYGAKTGLSLATSVLKAGYSAFILPAGMAVGTWLANLKNGTKTTFKQIANELAVGGVLGGLLHYIFLGSNYLGNMVKPVYGSTASLGVRGGCALAQMPTFLGANEYLNRALISDYEPKPLSNMWKQLKGPMKWIIPPVVANFTVVPNYLQMPTAAGISVAYGLLKSEPKKEEKKEKAPETYQLPQPAQSYAMKKAA